ncbi:hypothetical protein [Maridesulfovibrio sp.]|uniref:hypothetical protein n=1 Tax=Maridesulfovibrio sp. TaxID=2795000 RepID=UPI0029CA8AA5|nr:hypothetical protein [Maridesulfovibrio sp.]
MNNHDNLSILAFTDSRQPYKNFQTHSRMKPPARDRSHQQSKHTLGQKLLLIVDKQLSQA